MTDIADEELFALSVDFTQMCMNNWSNRRLPQEPMARAFVMQGALLTAAIVGAPQCAADLREMADQIELGNMPTQGCG
jgi:hypothetical protein